jgi:formylglycine-generating enzyme required for sulfatase activity
MHRFTRKSIRALAVTASFALLVMASAAFAQAERAAQAATTAGREGMVLVPAGEFMMGSAATDPTAKSDEQPQRIVRLPAFLIDELEVTNIEYKRFVDATNWPAPSGWIDGKYAENFEFLPVTGVTWWDAMAYARWVGKRLPTEAEWEKAARGTKGGRFPWDDQFAPERANNDIGLLPSGSLPTGASPYGAMDMAGNAAEWTASIYAPYPHEAARVPAELGGAAAGAAPEVDVATLAAAATPPNPAASMERPEIAANDPRLAYFPINELQDERARVYRGGSFNSYSGFLRCANRQKASPSERWDNIGFRCAADPGNQPPQGRAP